MTENSSNSSLAALDWLRFPMAVCVVFIHSYGTRVADCAHFAADPWSWESLYDAVRLFGSKVFPGFAVPTFFLISGYLFFRNMQAWDWTRYGQKLRRRISTLLVPYLGWNAFHCVHLSWPLLVRIFRGEADWALLWKLWQKFGGWRMFWDGHLFRPVYDNILGVPMASTAPVLGPLWFLRDLMVAVLLAPLLYWLLRQGGRWVVALFGVCFVFNIWFPLHGTSAVCTFWFAWGAWHALEGKDLVGSMRRLRGAAYPVALAALALLLWLRCSVPGPDSLGLRLLNSVYVLAAVVSAVSVAGAVARRGWRWPAWMTASSFFIYLSHIFLRKQVLRPFLPLLRSGSYPLRLLAYLLVPLLTVALCVGIHALYSGCRRPKAAQRP